MDLLLFRPAAVHSVAYFQIKEAPLASAGLVRYDRLSRELSSLISLSCEGKRNNEFDVLMFVDVRRVQAAFKLCSCSVYVGMHGGHTRPIALSHQYQSALGSVVSA